MRSPEHEGTLSPREFAACFTAMVAIVGAIAIFRPGEGEPEPTKPSGIPTGVSIDESGETYWRMSNRAFYKARCLGGQELDYEMAYQESDYVDGNDVPEVVYARCVPKE